MGPSLSNSSSSDLSSPETRASDPCLESESASTAAKAGLEAKSGLAATTLAGSLDEEEEEEEDALAVVVVLVAVLAFVDVAVRGRTGNDG